MKTYLPKFAIKKYSTYVAMTVIFVHNYVLDKDLNCTCDAEGSCNSYMCLPFFILFALQLWTDELFKRVWKYSCRSPICCNFFVFFCIHFMKAVCIGLLWVVFVFIDGDWFVCCWNTYKEHPQLGCKDKKNITAEEQVLIAKLKNKSMIIGLGILLAGFLVVSLVLPLGWKKCCEKNKKCSSCCDRKLLYDQMILEEEENVLTEMIRKAAKDKLSEEIQKTLNSERWGESFDVADHLITSRTLPGRREDISMENRQPEGGPPNG